MAICARMTLGTAPVLWDFDTAQEFRTTNGVKGHGGSMNGAGPAIVSGMVYVNTVIPMPWLGMCCWPFRSIPNENGTW